MTQSPVNSEQVAALFAERQRYESWLATLESKRATTPQHIYHRVHADYTARLQRVIEQLTTHRAALQEIETSLAGRLTALDIDEAKHRDEAAETELRAAVGELTVEHHREVRTRTETAIAAVTAERAEVAEELRRLRAVLESGGTTPVSEVPPASAPAEPAPRERRSVAAPPPASAPAQRVSGAVEPGRAKHDDWDLSLEQVPDPSANPATPVGGASGRRPSGDLRIEPSVQGGPFDDLEFLKTMIDPRSSGESVAVGSGAGTGGDHARAAAGGAGTPADPRASGVHPIGTGEASTIREPAEQVKTLKCQECGTLNYPTEWYCERCGAELAAL